MKIELILKGENEYIITKDVETQCTIMRHWKSINDVEPEEDFKARAIKQYDSYVEDLKTFKHNRKVIRSTEL